MHSLVFLLLFVLCAQAESSLLVLEFKAQEHTTWHGEEVGAIACGLYTNPCFVEYTDSFGEQSFAGSINEKLKQASVINMSFSIFAPHAPRRDIRDLINGNTAQYEEDLLQYQEALVTFNQEKQFLEKTLKQNQDKLFVIAAGNGFALEAMTIPGMVLSERYALYPSIFNFENTLKVAALESNGLLDNFAEYKLAYYSSYSTEFVDIAAPVALNTAGEIQRGTSFAAPWVSGHLAALIAKFPNLSANVIKKLAMRSAVIPNIKRALLASKDFNLFAERSLLYRAQHESNKVKRQALIEELGLDILLVRSAGVLSPKLLNRCAQIYSNESGLSPDEACLRAHKEVMDLDEQKAKELQELWTIRQI